MVWGHLSHPYPFVCAGPGTAQSQTPTRLVKVGVDAHLDMPPNRHLATRGGQAVEPLQPRVIEDGSDGRLVFANFKVTIVELFESRCAPRNSDHSGIPVSSAMC